MNRRLTIGRLSAALVAVMALLTGCEAPLNLEGVEREQAKPVLRFDQFQDVAGVGQRIALVGANGTVLSSTDAGNSWQRQQLDGRPSLIGVSACPDGSFAALDHDRRVWLSTDALSWQSRAIATEEGPLAIACDPRNRLWVTASFSTLLVSADKGASWEMTSQDEDLVFGTLQFVDEKFAVATGEFGALLISSDGGDNWERGADLPGEFYPLAAHFENPQRGWVAGLNGAILATEDGGENWSRESVASEAPIYKLLPHKGSLYAAGNQGTLLRRDAEGSWARVEEAPLLLAYLRPMLSMPNGELLVAGGGGTLEMIATAAGKGSDLARKAGD